MKSGLRKPSDSNGKINYEGDDSNFNTIPSHSSDLTSMEMCDETGLVLNNYQELSQSYVRGHASGSRGIRRSRMAVYELICKQQNIPTRKSFFY